MKKRASGLLLLTAMAAIGAAGIAACRTGREARRPELDQAMRRDPAPAATPQAQPETTPSLFCCIVFGSCLQSVAHHRLF